MPATRRSRSASKRNGTKPLDNTPAFDRRFQLPLGVVELRPFHEKVGGFLADKDVPIYLDTSVLTWMLKVGSSARAELLRWCGVLDGRVHVPVWAAHELHRILRAKAPLEDTRAVLTRHREGLQALLNDVSFQAGPDRCGGDADRFVGDVRTDVADLWSKLQMMTKGDGWYRAAEDEVVGFVNDRILGGNLFELLDLLLPTAEKRLAVRLPPGFNDLHKEENKIGDLVFWKEVLRDAAQRGARRLVVLTNDNKSDWSFVPARLQDYAGNERGVDPLDGVHARLAHPMLVHEARLADFRDIIVIDPPVLAVTLDRTIRHEVRAFVAATHPSRLQTGSDPGIAWRTIDPPPSKKQQKREAHASRTPPAPLPLPDRLVAALRERTEPEGVVAGLLAALEGGVSERSQALDAFISLDVLTGPELGVTALVGRRLYEAASGDERFAVVVREIVERLGSANSDSANALLAGLLAELYLDDELRLRVTPHPGPYHVLFELSAQAVFAPATEALLRLIGSGASTLLALPGHGPDEVPVKVVAKRLFSGEAKQLQQVQAGEVELLCEVESGDAHSLRRLMGRDAGSLAEVLDVVARRFTIPVSLLTPDLERDTPRTWSPILGLRVLPPDKGGVVDPSAAAPS